MLLKIAMTIVVLFLIFCYLIHGKKATFDKRPYSHRGFYTKDKNPPENTLAAFQRAIDHNYGIELDLQLSKDKEVFVFHDETLKRMLKDKRKFFELNSEEIKSLDMHGHSIPSFKETLDLIKGQIPLIVELKSHAEYKVLCEKTAALLDTYEGDYVIESFDPRIVYWFKKNRPNVRRGILIMNSKKYKSRIGGIILNSLILNVFMRPHFVALGKDVVDSNPSVLLYRYLKGQIVVWTILEKDSYRKEDIVIFEHFVL